MKKRIFSAILACLMLLFAGCQGNPTTGGDNSNSQSQASSYNFTYKGTKITLHAPAEPIIQALGDPVSYTESASCAFDGLDKSYYYGSFYLETYPKDGKDYVYGWYFKDDSVATEKGISIGATKEAVTKAYGNEGFNGSNAWVLKDGGGTLTIILDKDAVSSIQYAIVVE